MDFDIASVKITGNPDAGGWAQVHDFKPEDEQKLEVRGHIFALIATNDSKLGIDSISSGREILSRLHEEYYGSLETSAFYALKEAVEKVIKEFSSLGQNIEIAAVSFVKGVLYSACGGGSQAVIFRNNMIAKILTSDKETVVSASGYPKDNDIFILGTSSFFKNFTDGTIRANLEGGSLDKANESFAGTIHSLPDSGNFGLVLLSFKSSNAVYAMDLSDKDTKKTLFQKRKLSVFGSMKILTRLKESVPKKVYVRRGVAELGAEKSKKTILSVGIILIFLLFVSIVFGIKQKRSKDFRLTYEQNLVKAQHNFDESQKLFSLNPERARELLAESRTLVDELISKGIEDPDLEELERKISENEGLILGEYQAKPELYLDLTLLSNGFKADKIATSTQDMVALDTTGRKIVKITIESKRSEVVAGPDQIQDAKDVAIYSDRVFILSEEGIYEVGDEADKLIDKDWGNTSFIHAYAANMYLMDVENNNIYRFTGVGTGFANKQQWLSEEDDFGSFSSWVIDGSVWVLKGNVQIYKYTQGARKSFEIKGVSPVIQKIEVLYTNEELDFLYLLDKETGRVVVVDKDGDFKAQYLDSGLTRAKGMGVSEAEKKIIYLTDESRLYSIEIKHL
jgi:hypothetical protein